jgi:hypothetical protein
MTGSLMKEGNTMGTGRTLRKLSQVRPIKGDKERRRRQKVQVRRLVALGMKADAVANLNPRQIADLLKYPAKLKTKLAKQK